MIKIMFICHGNICRSPMAEFVFKDIVNKAEKNDEFIINSCATSYEEIGNGVHYGTKQKLAQVGIKCYPHKSVRLMCKDYENYDLLIAMDKNNLRNISSIIGSDTKNKVHLLLEYAGRPDDIADPWYTGNFDETYNDILEGCTALFQKLIKR